MNRANLILAAYVALIGALLFATPAHSTTRCRGTNGRFVKCPPPPAPTPTPVPLGGEATIPDNFDASVGLQPTWTNPRGGIAPPSTDPVGSFRLFCTPGQLLRDDPIVYPGQPGVSHLHQFFGNTGANAFSTYQSLRTTGGTTCGQSATPINRTSMWAPAMLDGAGSAVKPDYLNLYYKRDPLSDPLCNDVAVTFGVGQCTELPNGIRWVFGYNMTTGVGGPDDTKNDPQWFDRPITFQCWAQWDGSAGTGGATGYYRTIEQVRAAGCPVGARLMIVAAAYNCWDGKNVDSADHRSHVAVSTGPMYASQMFRACPADHPYVIANVEVQIAYTTDANFAAGKWHLSSDEMVPGAAPGSTWHLDYWEAWSPSVKKTWHANCIDLKLTCSEGDLGNGQQIIGAGVPNGWWPTHQTVPLSSIP